LLPTIEDQVFAFVDERALELEPELLEHVLRARVVLHGEADELVQSERLLRMANHSRAHLGRIPPSPELRADDVAELDLVELLESPAVELAAADEDAVFIPEHPDAESVLAPVRQLSVDELARFLLAVGGRVERGDDELVAMERAQVVEVRLGERAADQPPRDDRAAA
jgi:hypothetical protein